MELNDASFPGYDEPFKRSVSISSEPLLLFNHSSKKEINGIRLDRLDVGLRVQLISSSKRGDLFYCGAKTVDLTSWPSRGAANKLYQ